jgi:hypothetical protein
MFERLTADKVYLNSIRFGIQVNFPPHCGHEKAKEVDDFVKNVFDRLAAYEDSGLSPEEVTERAYSRFPLGHYSQQKRVSRVNVQSFRLPLTLFFLWLLGN